MAGLFVRNIKKSIEFYTKAFGFKELEGTSEDENGDVQHAMLQLGECVIMLTPEGAFDLPHLAPASSGKPSPMGLYVYVEDVDKLYEQAAAVGAKSLNKPADAFWGDRHCRIADIDGYEWSFATYIGRVDHHHHHGDNCC